MGIVPCHASATNYVFDRSAARANLQTFASVVTCDPANDGHPESGQWFLALAGGCSLCLGVESQGAFDLRP
jgi:hypothetical protein